MALGNAVNRGHRGKEAVRALIRRLVSPETAAIACGLSLALLGRGEVGWSNLQILVVPGLMAIVPLAVLLRWVEKRLQQQMREPANSEPAGPTSEDTPLTLRVRADDVPPFVLEIHELDTERQEVHPAEHLIGEMRTRLRRLFWISHRDSIAMLFAYIPLAVMGSRLEDSPVAGWPFLAFLLATGYVTVEYVQVRSLAAFGLAYLVSFCWTCWLAYVAATAVLTAVGWFATDRPGLALALGLAAIATLLIRGNLRRRSERRVLAAQRSSRAVRLLYLWVFGTKSIDYLSANLGSWRTIGPTWFLRGKGFMIENALSAIINHFLRRRVVVSERAALTRQLRRFDAAPQAFGLFHQRSFICGDAVWRPALNAMLNRSDAVIMNLSGFGRDNRGCSYELGRLIDRFPVDRLALLISEETDLDYLREVMEREWRAMAANSPNRRETGSPIRLLKLGAPEESEEGHASTPERKRSIREAEQIIRFLAEGVAKSAAPAARQGG